MSLYSNISRETTYGKAIHDLNQRVGSGGEDGPTTITTSQISDATTLGRSLMTASDQAAARTAIGAGTSSLALGSTASTAAAGNHSHGAATESASGFMTSAMVTKLNGIAEGANSYSLPNATASTRGGVLQGDAVADVEDEAEVVTQFNALLASLRSAGVLAE